MIICRCHCANKNQKRQCKDQVEADRYRGCFMKAGNSQKGRSRPRAEPAAADVRSGAAPERIAAGPRHAYRQPLCQFAQQASLSRKGNSRNPAPMESCRGSRKTELIHQRRFVTREQATREITEYIENFRNRTAKAGPIRPSVARRFQPPMLRNALGRLIRRTVRFASDLIPPEG